MNESARPRRLAPLALAAALLLAACGSQADAPPPLAGASIGGPFTLTSHKGERVTDADFAGQYRLVYFGFTYCPDVCPVDLQVIGAGLRQFESEHPERAAKVTPIFITTDPTRDTPEVVAEYVSAFHPRLVGLTGSEEEIAATAREFGVYYAKRGDDPENYLVDHSRMAVLFGPAGEPIAIVPHDQGPAGIAGELGKWVK